MYTVSVELLKYGLAIGGGGVQIPPVSVLPLQYSAIFASPIPPLLAALDVVHYQPCGQTPIGNLSCTVSKIQIVCPFKF